MDYSVHGSNLQAVGRGFPKDHYSLGNPDDFYQQAPFLTIAEDLLKLIKEDKIKKLVFLSTGDERKYEVFRETFGKPEIAHKVIYGEGRGKQGIAVVPEPFISLRLMSEERKKPPYPQTKVD